MSTEVPSAPLILFPQDRVYVQKLFMSGDLSTTHGCGPRVIDNQGDKGSYSGGPSSFAVKVWMTFMKIFAP